MFESVSGVAFSVVGALVSACSIPYVSCECFGKSEAELLNCKDGRCRRCVGVSEEVSVFCAFPNAVGVFLVDIDITIESIFPVGHKHC